MAPGEGWKAQDCYIGVDELLEKGFDLSDTAAPLEL